MRRRTGLNMRGNWRGIRNMRIGKEQSPTGCGANCRGRWKFMPPIWRKRLFRLRQFIEATRAAFRVNGAGRGKLSTLSSQLHTGAKLVRYILWGRQIKLSLWRNRMRWCSKRCPIYNHQNKTCGTPGQTYRSPVDGLPKQLGCSCSMPQKSGMAEVTCWLNEETEGQHGWPKELR